MSTSSSSLSRQHDGEWCWYTMQRMQAFGKQHGVLRRKHSSIAHAMRMKRRTDSKSGRMGRMGGSIRNLAGRMLRSMAGQELVGSGLQSPRWAHTDSCTE